MLLICFIFVNITLVILHLGGLCVKTILYAVKPAESGIVLAAAWQRHPATDSLMNDSLTFPAAWHRDPVNPESFHFLLDQFERDPLLFTTVVAGLIIVPAIFLIGTWRKIHPVLLWLALSAMGFGFSQIFPENRNQKPSLLIGSAIGSAVFTAYWTWRIAPGLREKFPLFRPNEQRRGSSNGSREENLEA